MQRTTRRTQWPATGADGWLEALPGTHVVRAVVTFSRCEFPSDECGRRAGLREMDELHGRGRRHDRKAEPELGGSGDREPRCMRDRASDAGSGEHTVLAPPVRAAVMVMARVQQPRRKAFGADLE